MIVIYNWMPPALVIIGLLGLAFSWKTGLLVNGTNREKAVVIFICLAALSIGLFLLFSPIFVLI
jgi:dolichyl-phosphate-mannose--protein O-mannosyl transferase